MTRSNPDRPLVEAVLEIEREFQAPRELVFRAFTDAAMLREWFCPEGCDLPFARFDPRVGGTYRACLRGRESGTEWWMEGTWLEIVPHDRIVYTHNWEDEARRPERDSVVTITLADIGEGRTRLTLHQTPFVSLEERDGHRGGWSSCLNRLQRLVEHG